jgi:alpha-L-fucosidase 2
VKGIKARGGFELDVTWEKSRLSYADIRSLLGKTCRLRVINSVKITTEGQSVPVVTTPDGLIAFETESGRTYTVEPHNTI